MEAPTIGGPITLTEDGYPFEGVVVSYTPHPEGGFLVHTRGWLAAEPVTFKPRAVRPPVPKVLKSSK